MKAAEQVENLHPKDAIRLLGDLVDYLESENAQLASDISVIAEVLISLQVQSIGAVGLPLKTIDFNEDDHYCVHNT